MKTIPFRLPWPLAALMAIACGGGVVAQVMLERASASVHRTAPALVDLGAALLPGLVAPSGFTVSVFARGLGKPRMIDVASDGAVYVTRRDSADVLVLRDADGDGIADSTATFASGLTGVHGIDVQPSRILLASSSTVWSTPHGATAAPSVLIDGLPDGGQHPNRTVRTVRTGPDGALYVSIGSSCNDCAEENQQERATMFRYAADGSSRTAVANGLRNTIGYDWHPVSGALWGLDHGSDFRGDDTPPEEFNEIRPGAHFGWPICTAERSVDPMTNAPPQNVSLVPGQPATRQPISREQFCARTVGATLTTTAHSAPMAMRFYRGAAFPAEYRGDAFAAMRGSWNRATPSGYRVARIRFDAAGQAVAIEDFVTGFVSADGSQAYARLVGVAVATDGALLVTDDGNGTIYRIAYTGSR